MRRISDKEKKIRGTYREDRSLRSASKAWGPYTELSAVPAPQNLPEYALQLWTETAAELVEQEVLTPLDLPMLEAYCYQMFLCREFQSKLDSEGYVITITNARGGTYTTASPYQKMLRESLQLANKIGSAFGFAPVHRAKVVIEPKAAADDPMNAFFGM